ncbi:MAG TPA: hypothetical protein VGQ77_02065, partial [Methylomirabilota bacterium]|nr:hypothetical protein [Methylomirabilota bacterium]
MIWVVGEGGIAIYRHIEASFDPETRADDLLHRYIVNPHPDHLRRYLEVLESRTGPQGRTQLAEWEPDFGVVHASLRERRMPFWLPGTRAALSVLVPADVLEPAARLEAEGTRLLYRLSMATAALHRESARGGRPGRLGADVQRALAALAAFAMNIETVAELAETRLRRWQRDVALGATLVAFGLAM